MKILLVNKFFYSFGGAERNMLGVSNMLKEKGHEIAFFAMHHDNNIYSQWNKYFVSNIDYDKKLSFKEKARIFKNTLFSHEAVKKLTNVIEKFNPDIVHLHNFYHQLSSSVLTVLKNKKIPSVVTLHDYKMVCPSYLMLNHGKTCELCRNRRFYNCLITKCFKDSFSKSLLVTIESYLHHYILDTYSDVKFFICPSKFMMQKMRDMGFKGNFVHLPNFVDIEKDKTDVIRKKHKIIYFGRISHEKGVLTLIESVKGLDIELDIIGSGPLEGIVSKKIAKDKIKNINMVGYLDKDALFDKIPESILVVVPSECYENNPFSILEAFALGVPVIGSRIGGIPELIIENKTGLLFNPGDVNDLRNKINMLIKDKTKISTMGMNARILIQEKYNSDCYCSKLLKVYESAINNCKDQKF